MAIPLPPISTTTLPKVVDAAIKKYYSDEYKEHPADIEKLVKVQDQTNLTDEFAGLSGLSGTFSEIAAAQTYPEDAPIATYNTNFTATKRGVIVPITWEAGKWSRDDNIKNVGKLLAKAARRDVGKQAAGLYTGGWTTPTASMMIYGDGKNVFSISHPQANGGTAQSNTSASSIVLSEANLWVGIIALQNQLDDRGETIDLDATRLVVAKGSNNLKNAMILLKSTMRPTSADNDINVYDGMLELVAHKYLGTASTGTSADNGKWYLIDENNNPFLWQWGAQPSVSKDESSGFDNDTVKYKIRYERSRGTIDYRGSWASYGDGSTTISA